MFEEASVLCFWRILSSQWDGHKVELNKSPSDFKVSRHILLSFPSPGMGNPPALGAKRHCHRRALKGGKEECMWDEKRRTSGDNVECYEGQKVSQVVRGVTWLPPLLRDRARHEMRFLGSAPHCLTAYNPMVATGFSLFSPFLGAVRPAQMKMGKGQASLNVNRGG